MTEELLVDEVNEEAKEITLSDEDMELLLKSIRPEWMPFDMYKEIRKRGTDAVRNYLKGKFLYVSSQIKEEEVDKDIYKTDEETGKRVKVAGKVHMKIRRTAKPYVKPPVSIDGTQLAIEEEKE